MTTAPDNNHREILKELYEIDPDLKQHEAVLPQLLTDLRAKQPIVNIDPAFVARLRSSLLAYTPASQPTPVPSPFLWWATRLTPVGVAIVLLIMLLPQETMAPIEPVHKNVPDTMEADTMDQSNPSDTGLFSTESAMDDMTMKASAPALVVEPPHTSDALSITSVTLPENGWIVVYEDAGGEFGTQLHASFFAAGTYTELSLPLSRTLVYPELVTVVVYTGNNNASFIAPDESVQLDATTGTPLTVTVPVVSELELEGSY